MGRPCVCGGSNENCRFCSGRGEIADGLANALVAHSLRPEVEKINVGGKKRKGRKFFPAKRRTVDSLQTQVTKVQQVSAILFGLRSNPPQRDSKAQSVKCPRGCGANLSPRDVDRHVRRIHPPPPVAQRRDPQRVVCPKGCGAQLNPQNVSRHIFHAHQLASVTQSPNEPRVVCPKGCGVQLNPQNVDRHLRLAHVVDVVAPLPARTVPARARQVTAAAFPQPSRTVPARARQVTAAVSPQPSRPVPASVRQTEYQFCPVCEARVKTSRLKRHLRKVHAGRANLKAAVVFSANDVLRETTTLVAPRDKNLDATKLYAHSYRESGRFGSHPSHDGFDDESGPD
jgi:hypothetical protein